MIGTIGLLHPSPAPQSVFLQHFYLGITSGMIYQSKSTNMKDCVKCCIISRLLKIMPLTQSPVCNEGQGDAGYKQRKIRTAVMNVYHVI